jgi:GxxExxY protein
MDLVVEAKVAVELKSIEKLLPLHQAQLLTYLLQRHARRTIDQLQRENAA